MPPVSADGSLKAFIEDLCRKNQVMVFSKTTCPYCVKVKNLFQSLNIGFMAFELNKEANGPAIQTTLAEMTGQRTVPNVFINGQHIGGCDDTLNLHSKNELIGLLSSATSKSAYEYDLIVIGGGSGGLAASKEAASLGKKVAVLDFVKPTPKGTTWGLGGTCVNVGCIPKKLMHQAALLGHSFEDSRKFGWEIQMDISHNWNVLREAIQDHISSLNWNFKVQLKSKNVTYVNAFAEFVDPHTVKMTKKGAVTEMTADHFILATGMRPHYLDIPGAKEFCITSDDLFSLTYCPGKTLVVGASYVSLECSGFLAALGLEVTVMVRSILLRGFDQQMAEMVGEYMQKNGIQFIRGAVPTMIEQLQTGEPGNLRVTAKTTGGQVIVSEYNTVILAIGRDACTKELNLAKVGVKLNPKNGKVITDEEQSSVPNIYAVGDVVDGKPELTPVAIQAGQLLAKRLYGNSEILCDYVNVPTTVFTPLEYGAIGFSEEAAKEKFGMNDIEVYHTNFQPLEWTVAKREENACYAKLICQKSKQEKVIGFHILGPNAGEITQGYAVALKLGATKADFDSTIGIHPTCSEILTTLDITKSSGKPSLKSGC